MRRACGTGGHALSQKSAEDEWEWTRGITKMLMNGIRGHVDGGARESSPGV